MDVKLSHQPLLLTDRLGGCSQSPTIQANLYLSIITIQGHTVEMYTTVHLPKGTDTDALFPCLWAPAPARVSIFQPFVNQTLYPWSVPLNSRPPHESCRGLWQFDISWVRLSHHCWFQTPPSPSRTPACPESICCLSHLVLYTFPPEKLLV